jgi:hypothetical protein
MTKFILIASFLSLSLSSFSQEEDKIQYRKLDYPDFLKHSINDTSEAIIAIFYDKRQITASDQISFFPITAALYLLSPQISIGLSIITLPMFSNGCFQFIKYSKKRLHMVLNDYKATGYLSNRIRKKAIKRLKYYKAIEYE